MYKNLSDIAQIDETEWVGERPYSRGVHIPEPEVRNLTTLISVSLKNSEQIESLW